MNQMTMANKISPELLNAYRTTRYTIFNPPISFIMGQHNEALDELLYLKDAIRWTYITAFYPFSTVLSDDVNKVRHEMLKDQVSKYQTYEGEGVGLESSWKPELSLLILGIEESESIRIGKLFEQHAIIIGARDAVPSLIGLKY